MKLSGRVFKQTFDNLCPKYQSDKVSDRRSIRCINTSCNMVMRQLFCIGYVESHSHAYLSFIMRQRALAEMATSCFTICSS